VFLSRKTGCENRTFFGNTKHFSTYFFQKPVFKGFFFQNQLKTPLSTPFSKTPKPLVGSIQPKNTNFTPSPHFFPFTFFIAAI
jgi:hypothetical protein